MHSRRNMTVRKELTQSLKTTGRLNFQEAKKLNSSVDQIQREFEKRCRDLSLQQSMLIASSRRRNARRGSLPSGPAIEASDEEEKKRVGGIKPFRSSLSDSALDRYASGGFRSLGKDLIGNLKESEGERKTSGPVISPLKLPSIVALAPKTNKIKSENIPSPESVLDKLQNSKFVKTKADALDPKNQRRYIPEMISSSPSMRMARRGSVQVPNVPFAAAEDSITTPNRRRITRRGSCPNLGWSGNTKAPAGGLKDLEAEKVALSGRMEELKKCRYLRCPKSIQEDEEEDIDSVF